MLVKMLLPAVSIKFGAEIGGLNYFWQTIFLAP